LDIFFHQVLFPSIFKNASHLFSPSLLTIQSKTIFFSIFVVYFLIKTPKKIFLRDFYYLKGSVEENFELKTKTYTTSVGSNTEK